jgi:hypothetical protein
VRGQWRLMVHVTRRVQPANEVDCCTMNWPTQQSTQAALAMSVLPKPQGCNKLCLTLLVCRCQADTYINTRPKRGRSDGGQTTHTTLPHTPGDDAHRLTKDTQELTHPHLKHLVCRHMHARARKQATKATCPRQNTPTCTCQIPYAT